jgi:hypothetical protein
VDVCTGVLEYVWVSACVGVYVYSFVLCKGHGYWLTTNRVEASGEVSEIV